MTKILKGCKGHPEPSGSCHCHQIPARPLTGHAGKAELSPPRPSSSCQQARTVLEAQVQFLGQQQGQRRLPARPKTLPHRPPSCQKYAATQTEGPERRKTRGSRDEGSRDEGSLALYFSFPAKGRVFTGRHKDVSDARKDD